MSVKKTASETVTIITTTIPERHGFLLECLASVKSQTIKPEYHIICNDIAHNGPYRIRTQVGLSAATTWLLFFDDDDLISSDYLEVMLSQGGNADIMYSDFTQEGKHPLGATLAGVRFNAKRLDIGNFIPITAMIRTTVFKELGGFKDMHHHADWDFWKRASKAGKTFLYVPEKLWTYRFHGSNVTFDVAHGMTK